MSNPTIKEIVAQYLKANGYDGLYNECGECACLIGDLAPCGEMSGECVSGYKAKCDDDGCGCCTDNGWHIQAEKPHATADLPPGEDWAAKHCDPHVDGCRCRACYPVTEPDTSERALWASAMTVAASEAMIEARGMDAENVSRVQNGLAPAYDHGPYHALSVDIMTRAQTIVDEQLHRERGEK